MIVYIDHLKLEKAELNVAVQMLQLARLWHSRWRAQWRVNSVAVLNIDV